jgi:hypothetical protein
LFCLGRDGPFTTCEHIFPEALGNTEERFILPARVVCDPCNNGPLASVDAALSGFQPIVMRRTQLRIPTKRGGGCRSRAGGTRRFRVQRKASSCSTNVPRAPSRGPGLAPYRDAAGHYRLENEFHYLIARA